MFYLKSETAPSQQLLITDTGDWNPPRDPFPLDLDVADFDGYIVVYNCEKPGTFNDVKKRAKTLVSLRKPVLLVSTRHQYKETQVSTQEGYAFARDHGWNFLEDVWTKKEGVKKKKQREQEGSDPFTLITYQLQARATLGHAKRSQQLPSGGCL